MKIKYGVTGAKRKALVVAISEELAAKVTYLGMPSAAYQVGDYRIDKNGILEGEDNYGLITDLCALHDFKAVSEEYDTPLPEVKDIPMFGDVVMTEAEELGLGCQHREDYHGENGMCADGIYEYFTYRAELSDPDWPDRMEIITAENDLEAYRFALDFCKGEVVLLELQELDGNYEPTRWIDLRKLAADNEICHTLEIEVPKNGITDTQVQNLMKLVESKRTLLAKALGRPLVIKDPGETLLFEFPYDNDNEAGNMYAQFATALIKFAIKQRRVTSVEKTAVSDKFTLRTFLVRLEMNGREYAAARKYLLRNLFGSSAYAKVKG